jgi:hypothetical protein
MGISGGDLSPRGTMIWKKYGSCEKHFSSQGRDEKLKFDGKFLVVIPNHIFPNIESIKDI